MFSYIPLWLLCDNSPAIIRGQRALTHTLTHMHTLKACASFSPFSAGLFRQAFRKESEIGTIQTKRMRKRTWTKADTWVEFITNRAEVGVPQRTLTTIFDQHLKCLFILFLIVGPAERRTLIIHWHSYWLSEFFICYSYMFGYTFTETSEAYLVWVYLTAPLLDVFQLQNISHCCLFLFTWYMMTLFWQQGQVIMVQRFILCLQSSRSVEVPGLRHYSAWLSATVTFREIQSENKSGCVCLCVWVCVRMGGGGR